MVIKIRKAATWLLLSGSLFASCMISAAPQQVSFFDLMVNKADYRGKEISVQGVVSTASKDMYLYASFEAYNHYAFNNSFKLSVAQLDEATRKEFEGKWVEVIATFEYVENSQASGSLTVVSYLKRLPDRAGKISRYAVYPQEIKNHNKKR
ncbi:hypothetical protein L1285_21355 [Pseudoalteromonas sp. DL2-H2.2]|uniref:hypothetical protein n=1 Tax=Pseudoalteromonas sp. DL2-H2.2 TaxID=2908889 RepID=UPI001F470490|nr:hypothetical protein [Pseudoalteromonas sp. DL2-H2.2]MCF2910859.1 hypothetical protein [Pseudoalteromonas sp. DL2-H2.2]